MGCDWRQVEARGVGALGGATCLEWPRLRSPCRRRRVAAAQPGWTTERERPASNPTPHGSASWGGARTSGQSFASGGCRGRLARQYLGSRPRRTSRSCLSPMKVDAGADSSSQCESPPRSRQPNSNSWLALSWAERARRRGRRRVCAASLASWRKPASAGGALVALPPALRCFRSQCPRRIDHRKARLARTIGSVLVWPLLHSGSHSGSEHDQATCLTLVMTQALAQWHRLCPGSGQTAMGHSFSLWPGVRQQPVPAR